jgi:hypothetical protein
METINTVETWLEFQRMCKWYYYHTSTSETCSKGEGREDFTCSKELCPRIVR